MCRAVSFLLILLPWLFFLSCVYLRFRFPISKTRTWGLFWAWAFPFICSMTKEKAPKTEEESLRAVGGVFA